MFAWYVHQLGTRGWVLKHWWPGISMVGWGSRVPLWRGSFPELEGQVFVVASYCNNSSMQLQTVVRHSAILLRRVIRDFFVLFTCSDI